MAHKITPKDQHHPNQELAEILKGVYDEAIAQGYSKRAVGRLFVVVIRAQDDR